MNTTVILAAASDEAVIGGLVGGAFVALALAVGLLGGFLGRERDG